MAALRGMWISDSRHFIYPRMFSVHDMDGRVGTEVGEGEDEDEDKVCGRNNILLPEVVDLSVENLKSDGIFLLDNSIEMHLWVGRAADASLLSSLFGTATLEGADMAQIKIVDGSGKGAASEAASEASRREGCVRGLQSCDNPHHATIPIKRSEVKRSEAIHWMVRG
jgi:protein transport protein SEC24